MSNLFWLLCIFLFYRVVTSHPFVFLNTCSYNSSLVDKLTFTSKVWNVEFENVNISFTLCGYLPQEICGKKAVACLNDKEHSITGKQFILGNHNSLKLDTEGLCRTNYGEKYRIAVKFECNEEMEEIRLEKESDCGYNVYMMNPKCSLNCVTQIDNQLIDLRKLKGNYFVAAEDKNFSIALCGAEQQCSNIDNGISICEKHNGGIIPLSSYQSERIIYNPVKNEIVYRGSYKEKKKVKKFELLLKCDWENNIGEIKYKKVPIQGKEYKFIMDTSYGCVKLPTACMARDASLIYNLTNLFKDDSGYQVSNVPKGSTIYLNICGPLNFKQKPENSCSGSFSQVCELKHGKYINRGSIMTKFTVLNDVVQVSYTDGVKCNEDPLKWHSTHIDFYCSETDYGPTFVKTEECDLFINWNTPHACPTFNKSMCNDTPQEYEDCFTNFQGECYDLSYLKLYNNSYYEIGDPTNSSIKYFLNVCGSITDPEAPCMKSSMVIMKDMNEENIKYRTKSLGQMYSISVVNDRIVITTLFGTYCGKEGDFSSNLTLICDSVQKKPQLVSKTLCRFQFEWRTPYGCLNKTHSNTTRQCLIRDLSSDFSLDFSAAKQQSIKININEMHYVFDICKDMYAKCMKNHCENVPLAKHLALSKNTTLLEMYLPETCDNANPISKVIFELVCDHIEHNEHFEMKEQINNCTVKLLLNTNLVCDREVYYMDENIEKEKYILDENVLSHENENCSVTNYMTGYKIYLNSLQLNITTVCPMVYIYEHNSSVVLIYPNSKTCNLSTLDAKYEYKAVLICSNQELRRTEKLDCFEEFHLEGPEFCKLFELSTLDPPHNSNTVTIVFSTLGAIIFAVILCAVGFCLWKKRIIKASYLTIYSKPSKVKEVGITKQ